MKKIRSLYAVLVLLFAGLAQAALAPAQITTLKALVLADPSAAATRAEKALASGACSNGAPSITTFVGTLSFADASVIRS